MRGVVGYAGRGDAGDCLNERVDERDELADLRRRAYGPDADLDAAGLARLERLEAAAREARAAAPAMPDLVPPDLVPGEAAPPHAETAVAASGPGASPLAIPAGADPGPDVADDESAAPTTRRAQRPSARRPVRRGAWVAVGVAVGVALTGGVGAAVANADAPDATLRIVEDDDRGHDEFWGDIDARMHELYHSIDIRSTRQPEGACLYYMFELDGEGVTGGMDCAPAGIVPTLSFWNGPNGLMPEWYGGQAPVGDLERGEFLRFELHGDVVKVWRRPPIDPSPAPRA